jgi:hypothetical protein
VQTTGGIWGVEITRGVEFLPQFQQKREGLDIKCHKINQEPPCMDKSRRSGTGQVPSLDSTLSSSEDDEEEEGQLMPQRGGNVSECRQADMPSRKDIVMELLRQKKISVAEVRGELEEGPESIEDMLKRLEEDGHLEENEGANILLEVLSNNKMPKSVNLEERDQTSSLSTQGSGDGGQGVSLNSQTSSQKSNSSRTEAEMSMNSQTSGRVRKSGEKDIARVFNEHIWPHFKLLFNDDDMREGSPISKIYLKQKRDSSVIDHKAQWRMAKKVGLRVLRRKRSSVASYMKETFIGKDLRVLFLTCNSIHSHTCLMPSGRSVL